MNKPMIQTMSSAAEQLDHPVGEMPCVSEEQMLRASAYNLLGALLRSPPDQALLEHVAGFAAVQSEADELALSMSILGLSASSASRERVDDEYHQLFIGIGRGELVPYGAWYLTGFLMEKPLGQLRDDLRALGFERDENVREPEDHAAALCEVMAMLIMDNRTHALQADFFNRHIGSWFGRFFADLAQARSADFYRAVGRFGQAFTEFDNQYLSMQV